MSLIVDGWVLPQDVYSTFSEGKQSDVPVIVGSVGSDAPGPAPVPQKRSTCQRMRKKHSVILPISTSRPFRRTQMNRRRNRPWHSVLIEPKRTLACSPGFRQKQVNLEHIGIFSRTSRLFQMVWNGAAGRQEIGARTMAAKSYTCSMSCLCRIGHGDQSTINSVTPFLDVDELRKERRSERYRPAEMARLRCRDGCVDELWGQPSGAAGTIQLRTRVLRQIRRQAAGQIVFAMWSARLPHREGRKRLVATASGLRFIGSRDYEKAIDELVSRDFEPEESFYQLLVGVTACFLCGIDPHREEVDVFYEFINDNLPLIRAAIDRVKRSRPQICDARKHG